MKKRAEIEAVPDGIAKDYQNRSLTQLENGFFEGINSLPIIIKIVFGVLYAIFIVLPVLLQDLWDFIKQKIKAIFK